MYEDFCMNAPKRLVIVPTFNEVESIAALLRPLLELDVDVLVVDDGSSDGTIDAINEISNSRISILQRSEKLGLGSAYRAGYAWALEKGYEEIIQMDADGSHQVSDLPAMFEAIESDDAIELVIGSRWMKGGRVVNWSKRRELLSRVANKYTQALIKLGVKDSTAGFRIYKAELLKRMNLSTILSEGYCFQIEMTRRANDVGGVIKEVPITFIERAFGTSKMSLRIVIEAMLRVTYWGLFKDIYHLGLVLLSIFTGFTTLWGLANSARSEYYASIAMSMSKNFGNFFFGAIDPAGTVTLDKIPGSYWLPAIFVKLFGFSTWAIIAPNALLTIALVIVVAMTAKRIFGTTGALFAGAIVATTPIVTAVARANQPQSAFLLTLALASYWAMKALQSLRRRDLVITGAFIALAFHTYMLEAWALWPALIIAWLFTAQKFGKKIKDLLVAGLSSLVLSLSWILIVWAVPAAHRPYIGGTYHNNPFEMVFGYNGLGRFSSTSAALSSTSDDPNFRSFTPPFGGSAGFGRIFSQAVSGQIAWLIPTAVVALLAIFVMKTRTSINVFLGVWLATFFSMFSLVAGIHQFYTSSLAIPVALLIAGAVATALEKENFAVLLIVAFVASLSAFLFADSYAYLSWLPFAQGILAILAIALIFIYSHKTSSLIFPITLLGALVLTPAAWAIDAHSYTNSINPLAGNVEAMGGAIGGPKGGGLGGPMGGGLRGPGKGAFADPTGQPMRFPNVGGRGGGGFGQQDVSSTVDYLKTNRSGAKFLLVTFGAQSAAPYITATGENILPIGGFDGQDPTPSLEKFTELVNAGDIRYVLIGGGDNSISTWVTTHCTQDSNAPVTGLYICAPTSA